MYVDLDSNNSGVGLKVHVHVGIAGWQDEMLRDIFNMALVLPPAAMLYAHVVVVTGPRA